MCGVPVSSKCRESKVDEVFLPVFLLETHTHLGFSVYISVGPDHNSAMEGVIDFKL